jgi:hypothetical protein
MPGSAKQSIPTKQRKNELLRCARNDVDRPIRMSINSDAHPLFEIRIETLSTSLRGALATKQSIYQPAPL